MLELKNVSKFYYQKGMIATGFAHVNLKLDMGEFVVITGESGSGKSTLLNVLSGLDTYEEGEMLIDGQETSHYMASDFEEYRKKYIGNIFQEFNLVNSYTVYQNIELTLLLSGRKAADIRDEVNAVIDKVGLSEYRNQKVSKLSGGQKQRVAIARALAKDTPIIVADEPTGSLDSEAAAEVIRLLREVSRDKLVIIVTHNLEQVEQYATRLIKMHDGGILEDTQVTPPSCEGPAEIAEPLNISGGSMFRLGTRNAFNILPKFVLVFLVFLLISLSLLGEYSSYVVSKNENAGGQNDYFTYATPKRIVLNKKNGDAISKDELKDLANMKYVTKVEENDVLLDTTVDLQNDYYYFSGQVRSIDSLDYELTAGRLPEKKNEIVILVDDIKNYFDDGESALGDTFYLNDPLTYKKDREFSNIKIVGYVEDAKVDKKYASGDFVIYARDGFIDRVVAGYYLSHCNLIYKAGEYEYSSEEYGDFEVILSEKVPQGEAYATIEADYLYKDMTAKGEKVKISAKSLYYTKSRTVDITTVISSQNQYKAIFGNTDEYYEGTAAIYVSTKDVNTLYSTKTYQASVFIDDVTHKEDVLSALKDKGYRAVSMEDAQYDYFAAINEITQMAKLFVLVLLILVLFFISYFVIRLIMRSRKSYFTTLRTLGGRTTDIRKILSVELMMDATLAFLVCVAAIAIVSTGIINVDMLKNMAEYLYFWHYVILYVIIAGMSYLLSVRYARSIFKSSVIGTLNEEV